MKNAALALILPVLMFVITGCTTPDVARIYVSDPVPDPLPPGTVLEFDVRENDEGRFEDVTDWEQHGPAVTLPRPMTVHELRRWIISVAYHFHGNDWVIARARVQLPDTTEVRVVTMTPKDAEGILLIEPVPVK